MSETEIPKHAAVPIDHVAEGLEGLREVHLKVRQAPRSLEIG